MPTRHLNPERTPSFFASLSWDGCYAVVIARSGAARENIRDVHRTAWLGSMVDIGRDVPVCRVTSKGRTASHTLLRWRRTQSLRREEFRISACCEPPWRVICLPNVLLQFGTSRGSGFEACNARLAVALKLAPADIAVCRVAALECRYHPERGRSRPCRRSRSVDLHQTNVRTCRSGGSWHCRQGLICWRT